METLSLREISDLLKGRARPWPFYKIILTEDSVSCTSGGAWEAQWYQLRASVFYTKEGLFPSEPLPARKGLCSHSYLGKQSWLNRAVFIYWSLETSPAQGKIWSLITVGIGPEAPSSIDCSSCFLSGFKWFSEARGWAWKCSGGTGSEC